MRQAANALAHTSFNEIGNTCQLTLQDLGFIWEDTHRSHDQIAQLVHAFLFPAPTDLTKSIDATDNYDLLHPLIKAHWAEMARAPRPHIPYAYMVTAIRLATTLIHFSYLNHLLNPTPTEPPPPPQSPINPINPEQEGDGA